MRLGVSELVANSYATRIASLSPRIETVQLRQDGTFTPPANGIEAFFLSVDLYLEPRTLRAAMPLVDQPALRWFHSSSAGIDDPRLQRMLNRGVTLTHSPGLHARPIGEYVIGYMLHHVKAMPAHAAAQARREWAHIPGVELTGKTLGIVGLGGIGLEVARLAQAFEMRVLATKRTPVAAENVDEVLPSARLHDLLAASDYVLLAVPLTDETRGMIGAAEFQAMGRGALLINAARGEVVDEAALIEALRTGAIGGAVLDVFETEPLPADSPLWELPNCVITPHDSSVTPQAFSRTGEHFLKNLARYMRGEPLLNVAVSTGIAWQK